MTAAERPEAPLPAPAPQPTGVGAPRSRVPLAIQLGLTMTARRLLARRPLLAAGLGLALTLASGTVERAIGAPGAVDRVLTSTFRLVFPLVAFALTADATGRDALQNAAWPAARFGAPRHAVALGIAAAAALACAAAGAVLAVAAVVAAHAPGAAPPLARDALVSAWIGALAGAAYAGWFSFGATFFRRGHGRLVPLVADLVLGGSAGIAGALSPRGNAIHLIGGPPPLGLTQPASAAILALSAAVLAAAATLRCRE